MLTSELLAGFQPDADALLRRVARQVDDTMLLDIARLDYGMDVEQHLSGLRRLRDHGSCAVPMPWHPREVLELARWSEPDQPDRRPGHAGERGHWMRAFACVTLLRAAGEPGNRGFIREGWNQTLIQLLDSLTAVAPALNEQAAGFLAGLVLQLEAEDHPDELGFILLGLLWLTLQSSRAIADEVVLALAERIDAEATRGVGHGRHPDRWLLGTTFHDQRHAGWERLGQALAGMDLAQRSPAVQEWVRLISDQLTAG